MQKKVCTLEVATLLSTVPDETRGRRQANDWVLWGEGSNAGREQQTPTLSLRGESEVSSLTGEDRKSAIV